MARKLVIAEKPSVARDIARALGGFKAVGKVFENDEYIVCSAAGHLVELCMPEDLDRKRYGFWRMEVLPILPEEFPLKESKDDGPRRGRTTRKKKDEDEGDGEAKSQEGELLSIIREQASRPDVVGLINACDAGREGELIFTYIYRYLGLDLPIQRLWLQSMTQEAIRKGFKGLVPGQEKARLADAATCRSESDWLVGINATRAFTLRLFGSRAKETANLGRVQTPTLAIMVERERQIENFVVRDFWTAKGVFKAGGDTYEGTWIREGFKKPDDDADARADRIWNKADAEAIVARCAGKTGQASDKSSEKRDLPPQLFDLTSLQREANRRFGYSARTTLGAAQALYERHKLLTYPRTDSKCLPSDYPAEVARILGNLEGAYRPLAAKIGDPLRAPMAKRIFDDARISDHFAIIPTGESPKGLTAVEEKVFDLVVRRFLAAFLDPAVWRIVERDTRVGDDLFRTSAKILHVAGWREAFGREDDAEPEIGVAARLPLLGGTSAAPASEGAVKTEKVTLEEFATKPPARYSDATLLAAMESAGKRVEDEAMAEAMKERGLGTPATRAETIEKLITSYYVMRQGRELKPTAKAMSLIHLLESIPVQELVSPALTGEWEHKLLEMERGGISRREFMREIAGFTEKIVEKARSFDMETGFEESQPFGKCPVCGKHLREKLKAFECTGCDFKLYKNISKRLLTQAEAEKLLEKGEIGPLDGFYSFKTRRPFSATLKLTEENKVEFVFEKREEAEAPAKELHPEFPCPICGGPTSIRKGRFGEFLGCANYPTCKGILNFRRGKEGEIILRVPRAKKDA